MELETVHYEREGYTVKVTFTASREFHRWAIIDLPGHIVSIGSGSSAAPKDEEAMVDRARRLLDQYLRLEKIG